MPRAAGNPSPWVTGGHSCRNIRLRAVFAVPCVDPPYREFCYSFSHTGFRPSISSAVLCSALPQNVQLMSFSLVPSSLQLGFPTALYWHLLALRALLAVCFVRAVTPKIGESLVARHHLTHIIKKAHPDLFPSEKKKITTNERSPDRKKRKKTPHRSPPVMSSTAAHK